MMICITAALSLILAAFPAIALSSTTTYCETVPSLLFKHLPPAEARIRISLAKHAAGLQEERRLQSELVKAAQKVSGRAGGRLRFPACWKALTLASQSLFHFFSI